MQNRPELNKYYQTCKNCRFTYLPMTLKTLKECPKCFIDDETYIKTEERTEENVSSECLFETAPKFSQDEFSSLIKGE